MKFWDALSLGYDALGLVDAVETGDGHHFAQAMTALLGDVGKTAKVKELTSEVVAEFQPEIQGLFTKILAHVNAPAAPAIPHS